MRESQIANSSLKDWPQLSATFQWHCTLAEALLVGGGGVGVHSPPAHELQIKCHPQNVTGMMILCSPLICRKYAAGSQTNVPWEWSFSSPGTFGQRCVCG